MKRIRLEDKDAFLKGYFAHTLPYFGLSFIFSYNFALGQIVYNISCMVVPTSDSRLQFNVPIQLPQ